jgi:tyrosyl-tRNA synthetase
MNALCFLRDIGKHFRVSQMLARDSVKSRMQADEGISYTEFSYQILQAYDFYRLSLPSSEGGYNCALQIGGSDQWGNIVAGIDYIRRKTGKEAFGLTIPLLCNSRGEKFGKSTGGGCLWLDPAKTSPYELYQYIMNVADEDIEPLLLRCTFHSEESIFRAMSEHRRSPEMRVGQKFLASSIIRMVHGKDASKLCERSTDAFF